MAPARRLARPGRCRRQGATAVPATETPDDPRGVIVEAAGDGLTDDSVANGQVFVYNPNGSAAGRIDVPERPLHERARCTIRTVGR
jgi:hypothetical protein